MHSLSLSLNCYKVLVHEIVVHQSALLDALSLYVFIGTTPCYSSGCQVFPGFYPLLWAQVHAAIRENPELEKKERVKPTEERTWKHKKLTYDERKANLKVLLHSFRNL